MENKNYRDLLMNAFKVSSVVIYALIYFVTGNSSFPLLFVSTFMFCDMYALYFVHKHKKYITYAVIYLSLMVISLLLCIGVI